MHGCVLKAYIRELCYEFGLVTSYMPVLALHPLDTSIGAHQNISLWKDGKNIIWDKKTDSLSKVGQQFGAGLMATMADFHLLYRPWVNSYRRFNMEAFNPTHVVWGYDNHFGSMRVVKGHKPEKICTF